jgi:hypothetical protein
VFFSKSNKKKFNKEILKFLFSSLGVLKIVFLIKFSHVIPVLYSQKKTKKIKKNDFWGLCPGLKCVKMDPKKLKKKYTVAHSIPDVTPRKKKISIRPGYYMRGLPVYIILNCQLNLLESVAFLKAT